MTTKKKAQKQPAGKAASTGRVRLSDDSLSGAGINRGDLALVSLGVKPRNHHLGLVFTALGELLIRFIDYEPNGDTGLGAAHPDVLAQYYGPGDCLLLGSVRRVIRQEGGAR